MSTNLYWEPVVVRSGNCVRVKDDGLKCALRSRFGWPLDRTFTASDVPYLTGLCDAGMKDAQLIIDKLDKHEMVRVWEE